MDRVKYVPEKPIIFEGVTRPAGKPVMLPADHPLVATPQPKKRPAAKKQAAKK